MGKGFAAQGFGYKHAPRTETEEQQLLAIHGMNTERANNNLSYQSNQDGPGDALDGPKRINFDYIFLSGET